MEITNRLFKSLTFTAVLAALSFSVQAGTELPSRDEDNGVVVRLSDLDLSKPADAGTLLTRIDKAAVNACTLEGDQRIMQRARERSECVRRSYANTLATIRKGRGIDVEAVAASTLRNRALASAGN